MRQVRYSTEAWTDIRVQGRQDHEQCRARRGEWYEGSISIISIISSTSIVAASSHSSNLFSGAQGIGTVRNAVQCVLRHAIAATNVTQHALR